MFSRPDSRRFDEPLLLQSGKSIPGYTVAYESYGQLNQARDNAILLCHGLTANAHAAGPAQGVGKPAGWWDMAIGPGKVLDTDRWFILCIAALGGFGGSTGPSSINPETGKPFGLSFPVVTIRDMVDGMAQLSDFLEIPHFHCAIGGCMGGFQVLQWLARYPERIGSAVVMGATARTSAHSLALWEVVRRAIALDPAYNDGQYYDGDPPKDGINLGTMFGMLVWMSREVMDQKFGLRLAGKDQAPRYTLEPEFAIQHFLKSIEETASPHFDPNSFIYLTKAMDYFDLERDYQSLKQCFSRVQGKSLLVSFDSDWRYPSSEIDKIRIALEENGKAAQHHCLHSSFGHGAFLYDFHNGLDRLIADFL